MPWIIFTSWFYSKSNYFFKPLSISQHTQTNSCIGIYFFRVYKQDKQNLSPHRATASVRINELSERSGARVSYNTKQPSNVERTTNTPLAVAYKTQLRARALRLPSVFAGERCTQLEIKLLYIHGSVIRIMDSRAIFHARHFRAGTFQADVRFN